MTPPNHAEETHLKLLDTYEQPEEFKRVLEEALAIAEKRGAERVIKEIEARMPSHDAVQEYLQALESRKGLFTE